MSIAFYLKCLSIALNDWLSKMPPLFKSFTGLTLQEFDDIYDKKLAKKYTKYEIQRVLSIKRS
jgi:hypothetical protein